MTMLFIVGGMLLVGWIFSLWRHPWRHCSRCNSVPRTYGTWFPASFRICTRCGGTGRHLRFAARLVRPDLL